MEKMKLPIPWLENYKNPTMKKKKLLSIFDKLENKKEELKE